MGLDGNVYNTQAQAASSASSFEPVLFVHCLAALDLGAGVEQPIDYLIIQNRQAIQSMARAMDWTFEDNMFDALIASAPLTSRRSGHTPFVQRGGETCDTGAEVVEPDTDSSWKGYFRGVGRG